MESPRGDIERTRVVSEPFIAALPKVHPLAEKEDLAISDFDGQPYISFTKDRGGYLKETLDALFYACNVLPDIRLEVSQTHAVISLVNHGLGVAIVPRSAQIIRMENTVYRHIDLPAQFRSDMYLVQRTRQRSVVGDRVSRLIIDVLGQFKEPE